MRKILLAHTALTLSLAFVTPGAGNDHWRQRERVIEPDKHYCLQCGIFYRGVASRFTAAFYEEHREFDADPPTVCL